MARAIRVAFQNGASRRFVVRHVGPPECRPGTERHRNGASRECWSAIGMAPLEGDGAAWASQGVNWGFISQRDSGHAFVE
jgi:hypothetical protein